MLAQYNHKFYYTAVGEYEKYDMLRVGILHL